MRVVVSNFYNEAYLLPWWLKHHREIFDHGILIDVDSTDGSADICRDLVPHWELVQPEYTPLEVILRDFEIMKHEARFPKAWKIVLNTTEYLVAPQLAALETLLQKEDKNGAQLCGAMMVDVAPDRLPDPQRPLTEQKNCGFWLDGFDFQKLNLPRRQPRNRLYHRYAIGAYAPGRHQSNLPGLMSCTPEQGAMWWYAFSPWCDAFKQRKTQIGATISEHDRKCRFGYHHHFDLAEHERHWSALRAFSHPLSQAETGAVGTPAEPLQTA